MRIGLLFLVLGGCSTAEHVAGSVVEAVVGSVSANAPLAAAPPANFNPMVSLAPLVEVAEPAVVNVYVSAMRSTGIPREMQQFFNLPGERMQQGQGSGFVISADGYILTNHHVAANADKIKVKFADGAEHDATIIGTDATSDVALLKIDAGKSLPYLKLGDSDALRVGDWVVALGNPLGLGHTVTAGIVSGKGRFIPDLPLDDFIQTDASINPGNSGGPLVAMGGTVVGMNTAIIQGANTVGFSIPANHLTGIVEQLRTKGKVEHGFIGISMSALDEAGRRQLGVENGVLIQTIQDKGPADEAGLKPGDVLVKVGTKAVTSQMDVIRAIASQPPGAKVELTIQRAGKAQVVSVKLAARPEASAG